MMLAVRRKDMNRHSDYLMCLYMTTAFIGLDYLRGFNVDELNNIKIEKCVHYIVHVVSVVQITVWSQLESEWRQC